MSQVAALSPGGYVRQGQRGASPARSVNVQVAVRCRPLNERERTHAERSILSCDEDRREVVFSGPQPSRKATTSSSSSMSNGINGKRTFTYDHVFDHQSSQGDVYDRVIQPIVDEVLQGYNCTVFAYGQTGTGKTHTMEGRRHDDVLTAEDRRLPCNAGIIPRAINQIFNHLRCLTDEHSVRVSHLELYNEQLTDLLSPEDAELRVYEDSHKGTFVQGLEDTVVRSEQEIFAVLDKSAVKRKTAETNMNKYSSRSHSIFSITIHIKESTPEGADLLRSGKLNLVDLAGSENVGRSGAVKGRAREAGNINQSLLTLGRVITALVDRHPHVPYRDSKLTRILQESLGGRNKTCIIATVTPASGSLEETLSTLDYAYRAKSIKNRPTVNQMIAKHVLLKEYSDEIAKLKRELDATREKNGVYLSPEEFDRLQRENSSKATQISSLETRTEEFEKKITSVQQSLQRTQQAWERDRKLLKETSDKLVSVTEDYLDTKEQLGIRTQQRDENGLLVRQHVGTERALTEQGFNLQATLSESLRDVNVLQTRVEAKSENEKENVGMVDTLKRDVTAQVANMCKMLDTEVTNQGELTAEAKGRLDEMRAQVETSLKVVGERLENMQSIFQEQEETGMSENGKRQDEFETGVTKLMTGTEHTLTKQSKKHTEACDQLKGLQTEVKTLLNGMLTSLDSVMAVVSEQATHINGTLESLAAAQKKSVAQVVESLDAYAGTQNDLVAELKANGQLAAAEEADALRASSTKIVAAVTAMMQEVMDGSAGRSAGRNEKDAGLYSSLEALNKDTRGKVNILRDEMSHDMTDAVEKVGVHTTKLCESMAVHRKDMESGVVGEGVCKLTAMDRVATESVTGMDETVNGCERSLQDARSLVGTYGNEVRVALEGQKETRWGVLEEAYDDTLQNCRAASSDMTVAHSGVARMMDGMKSQLCEGILKVQRGVVDGMQSRVGAVVLSVDQDAAIVPPRRQWPALSTQPLARTRNHESLILEARAKREAVDDGQEERQQQQQQKQQEELQIEIEDFGHGVARTPQRQGDEDEQEKRSSYTESESEVNENENENEKENDDVIINNGGGDLNVDQIATLGEMKTMQRGDDVIPIGSDASPRGGNRRKQTASSISEAHKYTGGAKKRKGMPQTVDDAASGGGSGTESSNVDDDRLNHSNSNDSAKSKDKEKDVLVDVSNTSRRAGTVMTRRSVRRIEPVIKKASGIPAPRRAQRRLHQAKE